MKLNGPLSLKQKFKIFFHLPGAEEGIMFFVISLIISLAISSKIDFQSQKGSIVLLFLLLIFPIIGFYLIYRNLRVLPRMLYALENGVCVEGELIKIAGTNTRINEKPLKEIRIRYKLYGETYTLIEEMITPVRHLKTHLIMVDANDPHNAVYLETLPYDVKKELKRRNRYLK